MALKLVQALAPDRAAPVWLPAFVKIAAIGTLADVVPLVGENRIIAKLGLGLLSRGPHSVGLRALLDVCGLTGKEIDSYHIGFVLAPRVNAAGRMSTPDIAARLLLATDEAMADEARELAEQLDDGEHPAAAGRGRDRRRRRARSSRPISRSDRATVIVVAGEGWHRGVIGIVASKLVDAFHRPAIVLSIDGDVAHGSCRSIPSFNMLAALESCADLLTTFGGHKQAAGLTMEAGRIREFRARDQRPRRRPASGPTTCGRACGSTARCRSGASPAQVAVGAGQAGALRRRQSRAGVHGQPVEIVDGPRRVKERHLKMAFKQDGKVMRGMAWRAAEREDLRDRAQAALDLPSRSSRTTWNGEPICSCRWPISAHPSQLAGL